MIVVINKIIKSDLYSYLLNLLLLLTTYITFIFSNIYYNSANSPDFGKYIGYINYYLGDRQSTEFEQGNLYYYLISKTIDLGSDNINPRNFEEYISYSIQLCNLGIYIFFLFGLYNYLKIKGFENVHIVSTLILLNFFPPMVSLRLIYKPEILILALLIWSLYFLEEFLKSQNNWWIFNFCLFLSLIFSTKNTAALMIFILLFLRYSSYFWVNNRKILFTSGLFISLIFMILSYENYQINNKLFFVVEFSKFYQERAEIGFLYNINIKELIYSPYKDFHNDSMIGIILLETFDDYFQLYWNSDSSLFHRNQQKPLTHFNSYLAIVSTATLYLSAIYLSIKKNKEKFIILSPLIGIISMIFISFFVAFEKSSGDMMKNYYYAFFLILSFSYMIVICLKETKYTKYIIIFSYLVSSLFIFGFPKSHDAVMKERISVQNSVTLTCSLNASIFNLDPGECETSDLEICNDIFSEYSKTKVVNRQIDVVKIKTLDSYELTKNNSILKVNNKNECEKMIFEGWKIKDYYEITKKPPFVNLLAFFFPVIIFFINIFKSNKK